MVTLAEKREQQTPVREYARPASLWCAAVAPERAQLLAWCAYPERPPTRARGSGVAVASMLAVGRAETSERPAPAALRRRGRLGGVAAAAALGLAALGPVLFLDADEAQAAPVLPDDSGSLNGFVETAKELLEPFGIANLYPHSSFVTSSRRGLAGA
jgi:hypothetical protein